MVYNKIQVAFGSMKRITGPAINYQYDVKQILVINGLNLPEYYVVDFCNEGDATVIPMTGTSDGVEIPDSLLQTGKPVKAYIVVSSGQGDIQTRYEVKLPVNTRPMRDDIHPTDQQQQQIDALVDALNDGVSRAEEAAAMLKDVSAEAETLEPGQQATAEYDEGVFRFGIPEGEKGDPFTYEDFTEEQKDELVQGPILEAQTHAVNAVNSAGTTQTNAVNTAGNTKVNAVNQAGTTQVNSVNQAGTTNVAAVNTAGTTQVNAVQAKGEEVIGSIPPDYFDLVDEVGELNNAVNALDDVVIPETVEATEALTYYPLNAPNGSTVQIKSKTGQAYSSNWAILFYGSDKTTILLYQDIGADQTEIRIPITASGIIYARPNVSFSDDVLISVLLGDSLIEKVEVNSDNIASNTSAIAENAKEIADIKAGKNNLYDGLSLILGRVFAGTYSDAITTIHCTDYLSITPGRTYAIYGGFFDQNYSNYYDKNKVYKGPLPLDGLNAQSSFIGSYNFLLFTAPSDAAYTRINYLNSDLIDGTDIRPEWYFRDVTNEAWLQKKILVIGDSISTDVYGNYKKWVTDLQDEGFISNGLVNNNSQHATGFVATYSGDSTTTFINRLTAVGDLTGLDVVITFGGINDWLQGVDFDAFKAAVDAYFAYLIEHATQARIIVFSPLHTALYGTTNSAGKTQKDYDDYIKSVAKDYAFPCLNLTDESGFCPDKSATFSDMWTLLPAGFSDHDGVHPIETWEKNFLAPMIKGFLSGM